MVTDPVCKMEIEEDQAAATVEYEGQTYYFCSQGCKQQFEREPERYLQQTEPSA